MNHIKQTKSSKITLYIRPKFKDYEVSTAAAPAEVKAPSEPTSPVKEEQEPVQAPEPKVSKTEEVSHTDDRIFSSPLARKLAEDNNVSHLITEVVLDVRLRMSPAETIWLLVLTGHI